MPTGALVLSAELMRDTCKYFLVWYTKSPIQDSLLLTKIVQVKMADYSVTDEECAHGISAEGLWLYPILGGGNIASRSSKINMPVSQCSCTLSLRKIYQLRRKLSVCS